MKTFDAGRKAGRRDGTDTRTASVPPGVHAKRRWNEPVWGKRGLQALVLVLVVGGVLTGCAFYGFSGASIPSHLETVAIPIAEDNTSSPISTLGRDLTTLLTDQFVGRTRLTLNNNEPNADAVLTARILRYTNTPTGVSGDERATTNSVEIRVRARYYDQVKDSTMVDQTFTGTAEYDPTQTGLEGEEQAARLAIERASEDIFTTATSNW